MPVLIKASPVVVRRHANEQRLTGRSLGILSSTLSAPPLAGGPRRSGEPSGRCPYSHGASLDPQGGEAARDGLG